MSKRAPAAPEVRQQGHLPNSEPEQRPLLRGSADPASAAVLQASLMEPAEDLAGPAQIMGRATPILALGSHFSVAFVRLLVLKRTKRRCLFGS